MTKEKWKKSINVQNVKLNWNSINLMMVELMSGKKKFVPNVQTNKIRKKMEKKTIIIIIMVLVIFSYLFIAKYFFEVGETWGAIQTTIDMTQWCNISGGTLN